MSGARGTRASSNRALVLSVAFGAITAIGMSGCGTSTDTGTPLTIRLTADRTTATTGQSVGFEIDATGLALAGLIVTYGDGAADTVPTSGASSAKATLGHAFQAPGSYDVHAVAFDAFRADSATDDVTIDVQ